MIAAADTLPCEGGCRRTTRAAPGVKSWLCSNCISRQAKRVRRAVMHAVAERVRAERRILEIE